MFCGAGASSLPTSLTVVFTVVFGVVLVFNTLGCYFGLRWKRRRGRTGNGSHLPVKVFPSPPLSVIVITCIFPPRKLSPSPRRNCQLHLSHSSLRVPHSVRLAVSVPSTNSLSRRVLQRSFFKAITSGFHP